MGKNDEKMVDEQREVRDELMKSAAFRKFVVGLMLKGRYLRAQGPSASEYERGRKDAICSIVEDFVLRTDGGGALVKELLEFIKTDKKEY